MLMQIQQQKVDKSQRGRTPFNSDIVKGTANCSNDVLQKMIISPKQCLTCC